MQVRLLTCCVFVIASRSSFAQDAQVAAIEASVASAISAAEDSVVAIVRGRQNNEAETASTSFVPHEYGTGVVVDRSGLILTNYHLLGAVEHSVFGVWHKRRFYPAKIVAADPWTDLAILQADDADLPAIKVQSVTLSESPGAPARLKRGQFVVALGNPYSIAQSGNVASAWGTIQNVSSNLAASKNDPSTVYKLGGLIQTDSRIRLGTSGGPLLNLQGEMIALVTSTKALDGYDSQAACAIAMTSEMLRVIEDLKSGREPAFGFLGIDPDPDAVDVDDHATGVRIKRVLLHTPAAVAGLLAGDIVTHFNGNSLKGVEDLLFRIAIANTEDRIRLTFIRTDPILRRRRSVDRDIVLSKRFVATTRPVIATTGQFRWRGMRVDYYTAARHRSDLLDEAPSESVRVTAVERGSAAWEAGLRVDQLVTAVNGGSVATPAAFEAAVVDAQDAVELELAMQGMVVVEPPSQD